MPKNKKSKSKDVEELKPIELPEEEEKVLPIADGEDALELDEEDLDEELDEEEEDSEL